MQVRSKRSCCFGTLHGTRCMAALDHFWSAQAPNPASFHDRICPPVPCQPYSQFQTCGRAASWAYSPVQQGTSCMCRGDLQSYTWAPAMGAVRLPQQEGCWLACAGSTNVQGRGRGEAWGSRHVLASTGKLQFAVHLSARGSLLVCLRRRLRRAWRDRPGCRPAALPTTDQGGHQRSALPWRGYSTVPHQDSHQRGELPLPTGVRQLPLILCKSLSLGHQDCHHRGDLEPDQLSAGGRGACQQVITVFWRAALPGQLLSRMHGRQIALAPPLL